MYEDFFEMSRTPFTRNIPAEMLYTDHDTVEIHNRLLYASQKQLFTILIGDSEVGKTTALRRLKETLDGPEFSVLYLTDSKLTPRNFYNGLLEQLGCEPYFYRGDARKMLHHQIEIMRGVENRKLLDKEMLEEIRFLLNFKMDSENPLALILSGQPELWEKLKKQAFRAVRNRIDIYCFLAPYDFSQTQNYIAKQMEYSGRTNQVFSDEAMKLIFEFSSGIPRLVNRACTQSLIYAYQQRRTIIDDHMVRIVLDVEVA